MLNTKVQYYYKWNKGMRTKSEGVCMCVCWMLYEMQCVNEIGCKCYYHLMTLRIYEGI